MAYYAIQMHDGELYHHGILGMKWGKRNGPPYPLGASDHSSAEKKAGWRKSLSKANSDYVRATKEKTDKFRSTRNELLKERKEIRNTAKAFKRDTKEKLKANTKKLIDNSNEFENNHPSEKYKQDLKNVAKEAKNSINKETVKKAAKIGAAVAVTGLAAYGAYKIYQNQNISEMKSFTSRPKVTRAMAKSAQNPYSSFTKSASEYKQDIKNSFSQRSESAAKQYQNFSKAVDNGKVSALQILDNLDNIQTKRYKSDVAGYQYSPQTEMQTDLLSSLLESDYGAQSLITKGERESWKRH